MENSGKGDKKNRHQWRAFDAALHDTSRNGQLVSKQRLPQIILPYTQFRSVGC